MKIHFDKLFHFFIKILGLILNIQPSPIDSLNIFVPLISNQLIPHHQGNPCARIRFKQAKPILLISKYDSNVIRL